LIKAKEENLICGRVKQMVRNASHNELHVYPFNKRYTFDIPDGISMTSIEDALIEVTQKLSLMYDISDKIEVWYKDVRVDELMKEAETVAKQMIAKVERDQKNYIENDTIRYFSTPLNVNSDYFELANELFATKGFIVETDESNDLWVKEPEA
jgi:hypothetical protein